MFQFSSKSFHSLTFHHFTRQRGGTSVRLIQYMLPLAHPSHYPKQHLAQLTAESPYTLQWAAPFPL